MTDKPTCGPLYLEGLDKYTGGDPEKIRIYAAAFCAGQAEKVCLGACRAAMFRPSADRFTMLIAVVCDVAKRYGLTVYVRPAYNPETKHAGREIWICRSKGLDDIEELENPKKNSPACTHKH